MRKRAEGTQEAELAEPTGDNLHKLYDLLSSHLASYNQRIRELEEQKHEAMRQAHKLYRMSSVEYRAVTRMKRN